MASILESYEKQYGNLTSEITAKLNNIARLEGGDRKPEIAATSRLFEETRELLEQMGLEIQELPGDQRPKYSTRIQSYRQELDRLAQEFRRPRYGLNAPANSAFDETGLREELLVDSDMRAGLLTNTERVERTGRRLQEGLRTAYETEEIGGQILSDLDHQRDTLQRSRDRLRHANEDLSKSSRIISSMYRRMIQNRAVLAAIGVLMLLRGRTLTRGTKMMRMRIMGCLLRAASLRSFSTAAHTSEGTALKCLSEAIKNNNFKAVEKIIYEQVSDFLCPCKKDSYEVRRVKMPAYTTEEEPNLIASSAPTRLIGCLCEPEANAINWMEISKGPPKKCYCGHWFKLVDFEEYLDKSSD
ncbi:hypothetical protein AAHC03_012904 [Spirometra sp. Aus1]